MIANNENIDSFRLDAFLETDAHTYTHTTLFPGDVFNKIGPKCVQTQYVLVYVSYVLVFVKSSKIKTM